MLLRLALVQALLEGRREAEALLEARCVLKFATDEVLCASRDSRDEGSGSGCAAVSYLLGCCLLRQGDRARGLTALEQALVAAAPDRRGLQWLLSPLQAWGSRGAEQLLLVHNTSEKCKAAAVEVSE